MRLCAEALFALNAAIDTGLLACSARLCGQKLFWRRLIAAGCLGGVYAVAAVLPEVQVDMRYGADGLQRMFLGGTDVTEKIRLPEISMYASAVSAIPAVRAFLLEMQRDMARRSSVIMDGRDIGTVVLPNAQVKIFLCADVQVRARRRTLELEQRGTPKPYEQVLEEMEQRDWADSHRSAAPLRPAEDAVVVDTTNMDFAQSKDAILQVIRRRTQP